MGRPSRLTPETEGRIVDALSAGHYLVTAAEANGVSESTVHSWLARGRVELARLTIAGQRPRAAEAPYVQFLEAVTRARAKAEQRALDDLQEAARGGAVIEERTTTHADGRVETVVRRQGSDWRAAAWFLEHASSAVRWRRVPERIEVTGAEGAPLSVEVRIEKMLAKLDELDGLDGGRPDLHAIEGGAGVDGNGNGNHPSTNPGGPS